MIFRCIFVAKCLTLGYVYESRQLAHRIDKSNPLVEQVYELAPLLNGILGPTMTKAHGYMITLYAATRIQAFVMDSKEIANSNYFTLYALGKVAKALNDIKFERSRVALKIYKKAEERGLVEFRKDGGETYITITKKGDSIYSQILIELITLKKLHSIVPQDVERSLPEDPVNKRFISKGEHLQVKYKSGIQPVINDLLSNIQLLNNEFGDEILFLKEDSIS